MNLVRRHPLVSFFVLAYAFSWSTSLVYLFTGSGPTIVSCGPALAAFTVLGITAGRAGVRSLFRSMLDWRVGPKWWAIAVSLPLVLTATATGLNLALGAEAPTGADLANWTNVLPTALIILLIPAIGGAWEEPGWRGFALPRLMATRSPLTASLVLGVLWAFWHLPVYFVGDQHWSDLVLVVVGTIVFSWLFRSVGGSVLVAMVFHALNNSFSGEYCSQFFDGSDSTRQSWLLVVTWGIAALLVICFSKGFCRKPATSERRTTSTLRIGKRRFA